MSEAEDTDPASKPQQYSADSGPSPPLEAPGSSGALARRPTWPTWVEILLCSGYPTQLVVSYLLLEMGIAPQTADGKLSGNFVFALSMIDTVALLALIMIFIRAGGQRVGDVFFGATQPLREIAAGVMSLPVVLLILVLLTVLVQRFIPSMHNVPDNPLEGLAGGGLSIWLFFIVVIVAGGVREELQRAFLLQRFRDHLGQPWLGLFITSLSFGMGHTLQGLDAALITGTLGALWGFLYLTRGGALAGMVSHSLFNSAELLRIFFSS